MAIRHYESAFWLFMWGKADSHPLIQKILSHLRCIFWGCSSSRFQRSPLLPGFVLDLIFVSFCGVRISLTTAELSRWNSAITWRQCSPHCLKWETDSWQQGWCKQSPQRSSHVRTKCSELAPNYSWCEAGSLCPDGEIALLTNSSLLLASRPPALKISHGSLRKPLAFLGKVTSAKPSACNTMFVSAYLFQVSVESHSVRFQWKENRDPCCNLFSLSSVWEVQVCRAASGGKVVEQLLTHYKIYVCFNKATLVLHDSIQLHHCQDSVNVLLPVWINIMHFDSMIMQWSDSDNFPDHQGPRISLSTAASTLQ